MAQNTYGEPIKLIGKMFRRGRPRNGCFLGWVVLLVAGLNLSGRTVPDAGDPLGFFTTVADKMLHSTFPFGVTNIPVCSNGVFVYTPAVQRLLQLSANIYDAANTNSFPVVFRPLFSKDASNNLFIIGYQQVTNVSGTGDPQLSPPYDVAQLSTANTTPIADAHGPVNVFGVPWIIGAKKGLPGFNQFSMITTVPVTRKLQVTRTSLDPATATYVTNQMYVMSISNSLGISFWNSYSPDYTNRSGLGLTVYVSDAVQMALTNGASVLQGWTNMIFQTTPFSVWPGSKWNHNLLNSTPQTASFVTANWSFNFLNPSVYSFNSSQFNPNGSWETTTPPLPQLPQFGLNTTNYLQAFILDGNNVIDYVQLHGPISNGNLNQALADWDFPNPYSPGTYYQWSTNAYNPSDPASPAYGVMNQLFVSGHPNYAPMGNYWAIPAGFPNNLPMTLDAIAAYFNAFYFPSFQYNGQNFVNTQLTMIAPYICQRTIFSSDLLQANDPLVHYLASDLDSQYGATALWANRSLWHNGIWSHVDDVQNSLLPIPPANPVGGRYQPWLQKGQMDVIQGVIPVTNNYAVKDPLIKFSDNWNFPTNLLSSLVGLGQVHRGTPWQTVYLKDADMIKNYTVFGPNTNYVGTNTWMQWTGDFDANDAVLMAPVNDWRLSGLLMSLLNTNDPTQLFSVNDPNIADWQNVLNGLLAYSNSLPAVFFNSPPTFDTYVVASNSPQAMVIAIAIAQARASQNFYSIGDILAAPVLTRLSPFINLGSPAFGQQQMNYGITDTAYEAIPSGLLPLLRPDSIGILTPTNDGWNLSFSGADGYAYALQTSTNLTDWNTVSTNSPVQGGFTVPVSSPAGSPNQFFRTVLLP